jgi:hypothetical protein
MDFRSCVSSVGAEKSTSLQTVIHLAALKIKRAGLTDVADFYQGQQPEIDVPAIVEESVELSTSVA